MGVIDPRAGVPLAPFSTLGVGGSARWFVPARDVHDVAAAHAWCAERGIDLFALGGGSNLVISDEGFDGLVLQMTLRGVEFTLDGDELRVNAGAGEPWDDLVGAVVSRGYSGIECLSGIPGSVGGTPIQNVGAYGQEVADVIESVTVFDRASGGVTTLAKDACGFSYRMSRFKNEDAGRFLVCEVMFRLRRGEPTLTYPDVAARLAKAGRSSPSLADVREAVIAIRRLKGMVVDAADADTRSVGSFFMNPIVDAGVRQQVASIAGETPPGFTLAGDRIKIPAAWLIERAGFRKGYEDGAVGISTKHPLAIVTRTGASARDVLRIAARIKRAVLDRFGVRLTPEPIFVGFGDDPELDFLTRS